MMEENCCMRVSGCILLFTALFCSEVRFAPTLAGIERQKQEPSVDAYFARGRSLPAARFWECALDAPGYHDVASRR